MKKILFVLTFLSFTALSAFAADNTYGEPVQDETAAPAAPASIGIDNTKIDQILDQQTEILKRLEEIQQELQIVKVRATQS